MPEGVGNLLNVAPDTNSPQDLEKENSGRSISYFFTPVAALRMHQSLVPFTFVNGSDAPTACVLSFRL